MELKKIWFPLVLAAAWVVLSAVTLSGFASFSGAARAQQASLAREDAAKISHAPEGRRGPALARR